jgi:hypothetical protein
MSCSLTKRKGGAEIKDIPNFLAFDFEESLAGGLLRAIEVIHVD